MSKKSPKRYIYDNGNLILKYTENESTQVDLNKNNNEEFYNDSFNKKFPLLSPINNSYNNNKIFSTQIDEDISNENKKEEFENNDSFCEEKTKKIDDYNNKKIKSIDVNPSFIRRNPKLLRKINQNKISSQIENICKYLYTSPNKHSKDNIKFKIFEKENEYIKCLTKNAKNYLADNSLINNQSYRDKIKKSKNNKSNNNLYIYRNNNKNILTDNDIIKKYYSEEKSKTIETDNLTSYRFENFRKNIPKFKHPQLYRLKNIRSYQSKEEENNNIKLPIIKTGNQTPVDLTIFIPVKKGIKKEEQRNEYLHYKIMKSYRLEGFHI